jgi:outer membrane protein TolC
MKSVGKAIVIMALILTLPAIFYPQEKITLTLDDCIRLALQQNPFYLAEKAKEEEASYRVKEAVSNFFPSLNAQGTNVLDKKVFTVEFPSFIAGQPPQRYKIDFTRNFQFSLALSVPLYTGGRLISGFKQANLNLAATQETIRQSRQETVFSVKKAFYGYLLAREFVGVSEEAVALADKHLKNVKNLYEVGMASKFDLLRSEVQVANLKPQLIRAKNGLSMAELGLKTLLGLDLNQPVEINGTLSYQEFEAKLDANLAEALASRPELIQLKYQKQMAAEMLKMARAAYIPTLAVGGAFNYWADTFNFKKNNWESFYSISLVMSIPIFNGFSNSAKVGETKAMMKQLDYSQKGLMEMVKFEVQQAILNLQQAKESLLSQEKNVEQAQEAVRIAELNYAEGLATNLDVSSVQVALTQAKTNYSQALYDYATALAQLEKAIGSGWDKDEAK